MERYRQHEVSLQTLCTGQQGQVVYCTDRVMCPWFIYLIGLQVVDCFSFDQRGERYVLTFFEVENRNILILINGHYNTAVTITYQSNVDYYDLGITGSVTFTLNDTVCYNSFNNVQENKATVIVSSAPITVYVFNSGVNSVGGYMAIPTDKLSTKYFLVGPDSTSDAPIKWAVVSTEDDNAIIFNLKDCNTSMCANHPMTLTLNKNDVFGANCQYDISGSVIKADKSIAVFTNTLLSQEDMLLPVKYYGRDFVLHNFANWPSGITYKIVASENNTTVSVKPGSDTPMTEGGVVTFDTHTMAQSCLQANKPVLVLAYPTGSTLNGQTFMVHAQPIERYVSIFRFDFGSLMTTQLDLYLTLTLTFHERHYSELPPALQAMASTMTCCKYMTVTTHLSEVDHNTVVSFPVGAVVYGADNAGVAMPLGMQFGANECPMNMTFIPETRTCIIYPDVGSLTWSNALDFCDELGLQLPHLDTPEKNNLIRELYATVPRSFFIGANDVDADGVLTWQDGEAVNYTNWGSGFDPESSFVNTCVVLQRSDDHMWAARQCDISRRILCQLVLTPLVPREDFLCTHNTTESPFLSTTTLEMPSIVPFSVITYSSPSVPSHVTGSGIGSPSSDGPKPSILEASRSSISPTQSSSQTPTAQFPSNETSSYAMGTLQQLSMTSTPSFLSSYTGQISPASTFVSGKCDCACSSIREMTKSELKEIVQRIKRYLTIEKNNLTNRIGRYTCRTDGRQSAANIGFIGITFLVLTVLFVIVLDFSTLVQGLSALHRHGGKNRTTFILK